MERGKLVETQRKQSAAEAAAQPGNDRTKQAGGRVERRRARTRQRLLEIAEELVRARGVEAVTIDDITEAADIARRSFYHHFESKHDLLVPIARAHTSSLNRRIDSLVADVEDPAEVASIALRHTLRGILADPLCCWFILHSGLAHNRLHEGIGESAARDLERGIKIGRFVLPDHAVLPEHPAPPEHAVLPDRAVLHHVMSGAVVGVLTARLAGTLTDKDLDYTVEYSLRILGIPPSEASDIAHRQLPPLPENAG